MRRDESGHNSRVGTSGRRVSRHSEPRSGAIPIPYLIAMLLGATLAGVAWVYLVRAAIDFGLHARGGQQSAWLFTGAASLGGVVCALLFLVLAARALRALGVIGDYKPDRPAARRRAT